MCKIDKSAWASLHTHSDASPDGTNRWSEMVARAKEYGQSYLALTDHGTCSSFVTHYFECVAAGLTPIFGNEMYLSPNLDADKIVTNHVTVLSHGKVGYQNLIELNNSAHRRIIKKGSMKFPIASFEDFRRYREGIVILTGCPSSMIHADDEDLAFGYVESLIRCIGAENVFGELMFTMQGHDYHSRVLQISSELGIPTVITSDTHFTYEGQAPICAFNAQNRSKFKKNANYSYDYVGLHLPSADEIVDLATPLIGEDAVASSFRSIGEITDRMDKFSIEHEIVVPEVPAEDVASFKDLIRSKLTEYIAKNLDNQDVILDRFTEEFDVVEEFDLFEYFYIVNDLVHFVRRNGRYSTARGSAQGSFLAYLLDIVTVDPIKYDLLFSRFLSRERLLTGDFPDIDLDIQSDYRSEVIAYSEERWGLVPINTIISYSHKSLVRDLGKYIPEMTYETLQWLADIGGASEDFEKYCEENPVFSDAYNLLIDTRKSTGRHAAAVASVRNDLPLPVEGWGDILGIAFSSSGSNKEFEKVGGLKFDLLSIDALTGLRNMAELTGVLPPEDIDSDFPSELFSTGKTLGLFQFDGSASIQEMCRTIKPQNLNELAIINALGRPGAMDAGTAEHYLEYRKRPRKFDPRIDKVLADTYSVIIYQENVMAIYAEVTGEGMSAADTARRVLSPKSLKVLKDPKWQKAVKEVEANFFAKGKERNFDLKVLKNIWAELMTHSRYSFNKSHSIAYADIAARQAWYKKYYPTEFYLSILNALLTAGKTKEMQDYIWSMFREGMTINPPSVIHSTTRFELIDGELYLPITIVKYVSPTSLEALGYLKAYVKGEGTQFLADMVTGEDDPVLFIQTVLASEAEVFSEKFTGLNPLKYYKLVTDRLIENDITELCAEALPLLSSFAIWNKRCKENLYLVGGFEGLNGDLTNVVDCGIIDRYGNWMITQANCLDLTIPNKKLLRYEKYASDRSDHVFGIIKTKVRKLTKKGTAIVEFKLTDNRSIRMYENQFPLVETLPYPKHPEREQIKLQPGVPVMAQVNDWGYLKFLPSKKNKKVRDNPRIKVAI